MKLVLVRIDDRLLHAQVALGWADLLSPDVVLIADDEMASDPAQVELLRMGLVRTVELITANVGRAADILKRSASDRRKCILLVRSPVQALQLVEANISVESINVGGMHFGEEKRKLLPYLYVDKKDAKLLERLASRHVKLTAQDVPGNPSYDVMRLLRKSKVEED